MGEVTFACCFFLSIFLLLGGKHPHCSLREGYSGSGQEWHREKWSLPHTSAGENRSEEGSHPG